MANGVLRHLRRFVFLRDGAGMTDGQLLECFLARREEAAFETLVRRHGPMVFGVCRRVLLNEADAEDAFQATFIVLARKAASIRPRELVGNWLYGVAFRTALKAKSASARRGMKEKQVKTMPEPAAKSEDIWNDLQPLLDHELERLAEKYRVPVVLCDLEGRTRKEVAAQLGVPEGTVSSRLATARKMLASRLSRRGLALSAGSLALVLSQNAAAAAVPASIIHPTVAAATLSAAGKATAGVISANVTALTQGVLKTMLLSKLKIATVLVAAFGLLGAGTGFIATHTPAAPPDSISKPDPKTAEGSGRTNLPDKADQKDDGQKNSNDDDQKNQKDDGQKNDKDDGQKNDKDDGQKNDKDDGQKNQKDDGDNEDDGENLDGVVTKIDLVKNTITLTVRQKGKNQDRTFDLAKAVQVRLAGKAAALRDVKAGMPVALKLAKDKKTVGQIKDAKAK